MAFIDTAKQSNFYILLGDNKKAEFFVQETSLPGFTFGDIDIRYNSNLIKHPGDEITWNQLTLQILCDEDMNAWMELFNMCITIRDPETNIMDIQKPFFDAVLLWTTNKKNIQLEITFHDAWLAGLGDLPLSHTTNDDDPIQFQADLWFNYYTIKRKQ